LIEIFFLEKMSFQHRVIGEYITIEKKYPSSFYICPTPPLPLLASVLMVRRYIFLFFSNKNKPVVGRGDV
jgi:hypothetical protein